MADPKSQLQVRKEIMLPMALHRETAKVRREDETFSDQVEDGLRTHLEGRKRGAKKAESESAGHQTSYTIPPTSALLWPGEPVDDIPKSHGVYWWVALDRRGDHCRPVPRALGIDPVGLLYIGMAKDLKSRLESYRQSIQSYTDGSNDPSCGDLKDQPANWCYLGLGAIETYPSVAIVWEALSSRDESLDMECNLLYAYHQTFAEMPPFNKGMNEKWLPEIRAWTDSGGSGNYYTKNPDARARFTSKHANYAPWASNDPIKPVAI